MDVRAEILANRIVVVTVPKGARFPGDTDMAKMIPGARFNKHDRYWHYPLNLVTCRILREVYTDMLQVGPELSRWARREINKSGEVRKFAKQMDAELMRIPDVAPRLAAAMANRTYQRVGARFIAEQRDVLVADEPSLGKTIQYLGGLIEGDNEVGMHLVTGPKNSLKSTWANEVFKWTDFHPFWMPDGRAKREKMLDLFLNDEHPSKFLIINPQMLQTLYHHYCKQCDRWAPTKAEEKRYRNEGKLWWSLDHITEQHNTVLMIQKREWPELFEIEWASVCVDEAHKTLLGNRGPRGKRTQEAEGFMDLIIARSGMRIGSTGTPIKGQALNFWCFFNWMDRKAWPSKWGFANSFLEVKQGFFGQTIGELRPDREQALYEALSNMVIRRTKKEVQPDLPDDLIIDHWVDMKDTHRKQYEELVEEGEVEIVGGTVVTSGVLAEHTRRKRFAFGAWESTEQGLRPDPSQAPKLDKLIELLEKRGVTGKPDEDFRLDGGWKYIIASQWLETLNFIQEQFAKMGIECLKIAGDVTSKKRDAAVESWQGDPDGPRVMLVSTFAGGTSLTLDAMCDEMFIIDETWVHDDQKQLMGRIQNREVEKRVAVRSFHFIRTRGTIEEEIAESGLSQDEFAKTVLDRSRGIQLKRREIKK